MEIDITKIVQEIQYVLAPAVMVSSSALLLLGFQNKFSNLANRFRSLNHERRLLSLKPNRDSIEEGRLKSLSEQVEHLAKRAGYVKNAILFAYSAIVCFLITSVLIFLNIYVAFHSFLWAICVFVLGLLLLLVGSCLMILETRILYKVITLEKES